METRFGAVLIKPDAIRDSLDEMILRDLFEETHAVSIFRKLWRVHNDHARLIYPEWLDREEFPSMVKNITSGLSLLVVVRGDNDVRESLKRVKGKMNKSGLRLKYRFRSVQEWEHMGYRGRALQDKLAENRLHTTDTFEETALLCTMTMQQHEIAEVVLTAKHLAMAILQNKALQLRAA